MRLACLSETEAPLCEPWVGSRGLDRGALELGSLQNPDKKKPGFNPDFSLNQLINFFFFSINFNSLVSSSQRHECSDCADKKQMGGGRVSLYG